MKLTNKFYDYFDVSRDELKESLKIANDVGENNGISSVNDVNKVVNEKINKED